MKVNREDLKKLEHILRATCHAPKCDNVRKCPKQCRCRSARRFELNTETAICWQIADNIKILIRTKTPPTYSCKDVITKTEGYVEISRFHMTRGWQRFFEYVKLAIKYMTIEYPSMETGRWDPFHDAEGSYLTKMISRLKRYPKADSGQVQS